ncbi:hypothetical protein QUN95_002257 [Vibrio parahaemolyticus]|nr:hypothetical protein [Vibrio parahaemolyticus]EHK9072446.1 hypothetical protein [Vibrio parahaemolyticus]EIU6791341.1 hypothetical protein [Vibrio parahaemolyticus]EIY6182602.1 hypothetical protein [Vibrio parahaemolyticus]EIZ1175934.1 hypothetical protein [Vibrio parahaemolyticus]
MHRSVGGSNMISQKIKLDVTDEFSSLKESLQTHLNGDFNVSETKQFLQTHVPKEIIYKSEVLLDTLLNYLMEDARKKIESGDVKLQNAFFDVDFRKRIYEWSIQLENKLSLEPDVVKYASDPRLTQGLIASGITFVVGTGITVDLVPSIVGTIVAGVVTVLLSAFAFKFAFDKASPKAREITKLDIDEYLKESQTQVLAWLSKVEKSFNDGFYKFCSDNGFEAEGK